MGNMTVALNTNAGINTDNKLAKVIHITSVLLSLKNIDARAGNKPIKTITVPSLAPRLKVTSATVKGVNIGTIYPNIAMDAACILPRIIYSAKAFIAYSAG